MSNENSPKVVYVQYTDKQALYNCFLSFCRGGGIFIPGANVPGVSPHLGTQVHLMVELPDDNNFYTVSGKVSWINMNKRKGIGIRLQEDEFSRLLKTAIENNLGGMIKAMASTYTM